MGQEEVQLAQDLVRHVFPTGSNWVEVVGDDERWVAVAGQMSPDAEISFLTPDGGPGPGGMAGPFRGVEGMRAGWREWLEPYDSFTSDVRDVVDAGGGVVVFLTVITGKMRGVETELSQEAGAVIRIEDGRVAALEFYLDQNQARAAAGL